MIYFIQLLAHVNIVTMEPPPAFRQNIFKLLLLTEIFEVGWKYGWDHTVWPVNQARNLEIVEDKDIARLQVRMS
jgi:hypothetical protein